MAMLYPTYHDLIAVLNRDVPDDEEPLIKSRYSVVIAAAKRARQLVDGADDRYYTQDQKPLSAAIAELNDGKIRVIPYDNKTKTADEENASAGDDIAAEDKTEESAESQEIQNEEFSAAPDSGEAAKSGFCPGVGIEDLNFEDEINDNFNSFMETT